MTVRKRFFVAIIGSVLIGSGFSAGPARAAATFTVTTANDSAPIAPAGSLRAAITAANNTAGADTIVFNIPGAGVHTISVVEALPGITQPVTIDGYTQPGAVKNSLGYGTNAVLQIQIDGSTLSSGSGLTFNDGSGGSVVRGLVISHFNPGEGIRVQSNASANYSIEGCFIGTDPTGTTAAANNKGIRASSGTAINVGGADPGKRNVIAGNLGQGVLFEGVLSHDNTVIGNLIGLTHDGSPLPNGTDGVAITGPSSPGNKIIDNAIASDSGANDLSIDLGIDGITANDKKDPDGGPNGLQNFPVLKTATVNTDGSTTITGRLNSRPRKVFTIQFFANAFGDEPDGETPLGQLNVKTNRFGNAAFKFITTEPVVGNETVTATATNFSAKETSEFSAPLTVP